VAGNTNEEVDALCGTSPRFCRLHFAQTAVAKVRKRHIPSGGHEVLFGNIVSGGRTMLLKRRLWMFADILDLASGFQLFLASRLDSPRMLPSMQQHYICDRPTDRVALVRAGRTADAAKSKYLSD
jgi:hypothetical protein